MTRWPDEWRHAPPAVRLTGRQSLASWISAWSDQVEGLRGTALIQSARLCRYHRHAGERWPILEGLARLSGGHHKRRGLWSRHRRCARGCQRSQAAVRASHRGGAARADRNGEAKLGGRADHLNKQIAADIGIAESTVKVHRTHLMRKMKPRSLPELSRMADMLELRRRCCKGPTLAHDRPPQACGRRNPLAAPPVVLSGPSTSNDAYARTK